MSESSPSPTRYSSRNMLVSVLMGAAVIVLVLQLKHKRHDWIFSTSEIPGANSMTKQQHDNLHDINDHWQDGVTVPLLPFSRHIPQEANLSLSDYLSPHDNTTILPGPAVDDLLQVIVVGFAKCGTSTLKQWLELHPLISMLPGETQHLHDHPEKLVQKLYHQHPNASRQQQVRWGYKNPNELRRRDTSMTNIATYFPSARLIITVRHPVTWFKSLWDYSVTHLGQRPSQLYAHDWTGGSHSVSPGVQTRKAEWHALLAPLGKTPLDHKEMDFLKDYLSTDELTTLTSVVKLPNPIFLVEMTQMDDANATRARILRRDMSRFLGLTADDGDLPPMLHRNRHDDTVLLDDNNNNNTGNNGPNNDDNSDKHKQQQQQQQQQYYRHHFGKEADLDICADEFDQVRQQLVTIGTAAAQWMQEYFVQSPDAYVSSPEYFRERLQTWTVDPCSSSSFVDDKRNSTTINSSNDTESHDDDGQE